MGRRGVREKGSKGEGEKGEGEMVESFESSSVSFNFDVI